MSDQRGTDQGMVDDALKIDEEKLNEWETEFIGNMEEWLEENNTLRPGQRSKLEEILEQRG